MDISDTVGETVYSTTAETITGDSVKVMDNERADE